MTSIVVESLKGNTTQDTFYIRMTAEDDKGNVGDYSNLASLTIADPQSLFQFVSAVFLCFITAYIIVHGIITLYYMCNKYRSFRRKILIVNIHEYCLGI